MGLPQRVKRLTAAEYLRIERAAEYRSEFFNGEMFAMAGGTPRHSRIKTNLVGALNNGLRGNRCTVHDIDLRIRVAATGLYTYPDASVFCEKFSFDDEHQDTVLNPTLLAEVLSDSTEAYDRGKQFNHYRQIPSLKEYLLIAHDSPRVERLARNSDNTWTLTICTGLDQKLELPSIGITISLAEIYDRVEFDTNPEPPPDVAASSRS